MVGWVYPLGSKPGQSLSFGSMGHPDTRPWVRWDRQTRSSLNNKRSQRWIINSREMFLSMNHFETITTLGNLFFFRFYLGGVLKGEVWRSKFSLRRLVTDNFPPKAGKSLARMVRPHNEERLFLYNLQFLNRKRYSIVVVLFPYAGTVMLAWGL